MKTENNPFNLKPGDHITIKGDNDGELKYGVTGFTEAGFPIAETAGLILRGINARCIASVIRSEK